jgi:hypothetical protein
VASAHAIDAQEDLDALDVLDGELLDRLLSDSDLVGSGVGAGVAGPQLPRKRPAGLVRLGEQRVKAIPALVCRLGALLVRMRGQQRRVQVDRQPLGRTGSSDTRAPARA